MISIGELLRLQTSDPNNPQYIVNPETGEYGLNPNRKESTEGGHVVKDEAGHLYSQEGLASRVIEDENYKKQMQNTLATISPYFDGDQGIDNILLQTGHLISRASGSTAETTTDFLGSLALVPSTISTKFADADFTEKMQQMGEEKAVNFVETLNAYGFNRFSDAISFGNDKTADQVLDKITKQTGRQFDSQEREAFRSWAKFQQKQKIEMLREQIKTNFAEGLKNVSEFLGKPKTTDLLNKMGVYTLIDAEAQVVSMMGISLIPYVGVPLSMATMGSSVFYQKRAEAMQNGWDIDKANSYALLQASVQSVLEYIPSHGFVKGFYSTKRTLGNVIAHYIAPEAIEEASQQLFEDTLDKITGLNEQTALEIARNAAVAGLVGGVAAGIPGIMFGGRGQAFQRISAYEQNVEKQKEIEKQAEEAVKTNAENAQELQQEATAKKEQNLSDAKAILVEELKKNYPTVSQEDMEKVVSVGLKVLENEEDRGALLGTLYNVSSNLMARLNAQDQMSVANMAEFLATFGDSKDEQVQRAATQKAVETLFNKKASQEFINAMTEVEMDYRRMAAQYGAPKEQTDKFCMFLRSVLMDTALQSGSTPLELMNTLRPKVINLARAKYNGQSVGVDSELSFMRNKSRQIPISDAKQNAMSVLQQLKNIQGMKKSDQRDAVAEEVHNELYGETNQHGKDMDILLISLKNDAVNQKQILQEAGFLQSMRDDEYLAISLLLQQGYSINDIAKSFGETVENADIKYYNAVQKVFPPLTKEELWQAENLFLEAPNGRLTFGAFSKSGNTVYITTDAPSTTILHELSHSVLWNALGHQYKLKQQTGIDMNTPISRYISEVSRAIQKETGVAPTVDAGLEVLARRLEKYYKRGKRASSKEEGIALYDAIESAENNAIKNADYSLSDFDADTKKALTKSADKLVSSFDTPSMNLITASSNFSENILDSDTDTIIKRVEDVLTKEKSYPLKEHDYLLHQLEELKQSTSPFKQLEAIGLGLDVANAMNATAAFKYAEELSEGVWYSSDKFAFMPKEETDAMFSFAGTMRLKLDNMHSSYNQKMFKDFWDEKKLALSNSSFSKGIDVSAAIDKLIESKQFMKRFIYSPYAYLKGTDLFVARRVRELTYQMQKKVNKAQESVRDFYTLLREGMRKNNVTNAMYHANYMHPYLNCTADGYEAARSFVEKYAGKKGLKAFDNMNAQFKQFANDLKAAGALRTTVEHFAPRHISNFPSFLEHLRREPQHELYNLVAEMEKAGKSTADIADAVNAVFYNKQDWEKNKVTSLNRRKVLAIRREDLMYYDDPFDAALKYFEDAGRTVVTRQMFGFHQEVMDDPSKLERKEALINLRETAKEKVLNDMLLNKTNELFKEIDSIDTVEGWLDFAKKKGFKSDLSKNSTLEELYKEKLEYEEEVSKEEMQNLRDNPEVQVRADEEVDKILKEQKRIFENTDAQYGIVGRILQERIDSGKLNKQQINDIVYALRSVNVRQHAGMPLAQWLRQLNSLTVIGASVSSTFSNLREMKLTASRWGYHSTLYGFDRAVRAVLGARTGKLSDWMEKIGLPPMNEFIRPQDEKMLTKAVNFAYKWTGFSTLDQIAKLTNAFAAEKSMGETLRKGNTDSAQYKKTMEFINRTFAVDPAFDADGHYKRRYEQVIEDLKNDNITEDVKFLMYNAVSDQQPINALEVPVQYNYAGPFGQLCYQFQTVSMKQFEFVTSDVIETAKTDRNLALQKLAVLAIYAAALGVPEQWLEEILKGRKPGNLLPEALYAVADYAMISPYFISQVKDKGLFEAYVSSYTPSANILTNLWKDTAQIVFGSKKLKNARTVMNIPIIGQLLYNWFGGGAAWSKRQGIYIGNLFDILSSFDAKEDFLGDWD